jgi:hypothetical protein
MWAGHPDGFLQVYTHRLCPNIRAAAAANAALPPSCRHPLRFHCRRCRRCRCAVAVAVAVVVAWVRAVARVSARAVVRAEAGAVARAVAVALVVARVVAVMVVTIVIAVPPCCRQLCCAAAAASSALLPSCRRHHSCCLRFNCHRRCHCRRRIQLIVDCCLCPPHIAAAANALCRYATSRRRCRQCCAAAELPPTPSPTF